MSMGIVQHIRQLGAVDRDPGLRLRLLLDRQVGLQLGGRLGALVWPDVGRADADHGQYVDARDEAEPGDPAPAFARMCLPRVRL